MKNIVIDLSKTKVSEMLDVIESEALKTGVNIDSNYFMKYKNNFFLAFSALIEEELIDAKEKKMINFSSIRFRRGAKSWTDTMILAIDSGLIFISIESVGKNILFMPYWRLGIDLTTLDSYKLSISTQKRDEKKTEEEEQEEKFNIRKEILEKISGGWAFYMEKKMYEIYPTFSFKGEIERIKKKDYTLTAPEMEEEKRKDKNNKKLLFSSNQEKFINHLPESVKTSERQKVMIEKSSSNVLRSIYDQKRKEEKMKNLTTNELTKEINRNEILKLVGDIKGEEDE